MSVVMHTTTQHDQPFRRPSLPSSSSLSHSAARTPSYYHPTTASHRPHTMHLSSSSSSSSSTTCSSSSSSIPKPDLDPYYTHTRHLCNHQQPPPSPHYQQLNHHLHPHLHSPSLSLLIPLLLLLLISPVSVSASYLNSPVHMACRSCLPSADTRRHCRVVFDGLLHPAFNGWITSASSTRRVFSSYNRLFAGRVGASRLRCVRRHLLRTPQCPLPTSKPRVVMSRSSSPSPTPSESGGNVAAPPPPGQPGGEKSSSVTPSVSSTPSPSSSQSKPPSPSSSSSPSVSGAVPLKSIASPSGVVVVVGPPSTYSKVHAPARNADVLRSDLFDILGTIPTIRNDPGLRVTVQLVRTDLPGFPLSFYPAYVWSLSPSSSSSPSSPPWPSPSPSSHYYPPPVVVLPSPAVDDYNDDMMFVSVHVTARVKQCARSNCAAMINIFSRRYLRRQAVRNAIKRVRRRPQFADVFDTGSEKFQIVRRGKRWFSVFVPFRELYLSEF